MRFKTGTRQCLFISVIFCILQGIIITVPLAASSSPVENTRSFIKKVYSINAAVSKIKIDAQLDEEAWKHALLIDLDYETSPGENIPPPVKTQAMLTYDQSNLYVAFRSFDPEPANIRAHLCDRDQIWQDDKVAVVLDTFNDENRAFAFLVNPLGIQRDLIYTFGGSVWDDKWDAIWDSAGRITSFGYVVEIAIPFRSLQFSRKNDKQTWGFEVLRIYPRSQMHWLKIFPDNRNQGCLLCKYPKLTGFQGIQAGRNVEIDPTLTTVKSHERKNFPAGPLEKVKSQVESGCSGQWAITPELTFSGALNPDFSQVEADVAQLDINKQFALYYPEKRPFFLEGSDFFKTSLDAIYTRTLADPDWGLKLSGKVGKNAVGFFMARDRVTNLLFPGSQGSRNTTINHASYTGVLRYRRDIGTASTVGVLLTNREGNGYHNRAAGLDSFIRITKSDTLTFQFLGTQTLYPLEISADFGQTRDTFSGSAFYLAYQKLKRTYTWEVAYSDYSPGFRADVGFMPQVDTRKLEVKGSYKYWGKKGDILSTLEILGDISQTENHNRQLLERKGSLGIEGEGPLQSYLSWKVTTRKRVFNRVPFNQLGQELYFNILPTGNINVSIYFSAGDQIDFAQTREGNVFYLEPEISYNFGTHVNVHMSYSEERFSLEARRLYLARLSQLRLIYHFNKRAFIRGILQYTYMERDPDLYIYRVDRVFKKLYTQFLFSYKVNPRTVLFLGYSDTYRGDMDISLTQGYRTFFMKIGYAVSL